ncbi:unnamed protein product [Eretmochelys imbricata]
MVETERKAREPENKGPYHKITALLGTIQNKPISSCTTGARCSGRAEMRRRSRTAGNVAGKDRGSSAEVLQQVRTEAGVMGQHSEKEIRWARSTGLWESLLHGSGRAIAQIPRRYKVGNEPTLDWGGKIRGGLKMQLTFLMVC